MTRTASVLALVVIVAVGGCTPSRRTVPTVASGTGGRPVTYAAIGSGETVGEGMDNPVRSPAAIAAAVTSYNAATARVVAATGAVLVDLHAAILPTTPGTGPAGPDGLDPGDAEAALVAAQFAAALHRAGPIPPSRP